MARGVGKRGALYCLSIVRAVRLSALVLAVLVMSAQAAHGVSAPEAKWPVGITPAPASPLPPRPGPAVVGLGVRRVLVFGGDAFGEGVSKADGHSDGAIFDVTTRRWTRIARAPFKVVGPGGVWTGSEVVMLGGEPKCAVEIGERQCRSSVLHAGVYTPRDDTWREFKVPARFRGLGFPGAPLLWIGHEALFLAGQQFLAVNLDGKFRSFTAPVQGIAGGAVCVAGRRVVVAELLPRPDLGARPLQVLDTQTGKWAATAPPPEARFDLRPVCTTETVLMVAFDLSQVLQYHLATDQWTDVTPPALSGFVACTPQVSYPRCDVPRWSGHGAVADVWVPLKEPGLRFDPTLTAWTPIASGPDVQPSSDTADPVWLDGLGATFATNSGPGTGGGADLLIYRPTLS
jgi:hypothetical protein